MARTKNNKTRNQQRGILSLAIAGLLGFMCAHMMLSPASYSSNFATLVAPKDAPAQKKIPKTSATRCERALEKGWYMSQSAEDKTLLQWFGNVCGGKYLEMGGLDGKKFSNTYVFNKGLDWKGVLVEASPEAYKDLEKNRPNEIATVHGGVCSEEQDLHWVSGKSSPVGGFLEFAAKDFQKKWWPPETIANAVVVKCRTLSNILLDVVGEKAFFDFYSLDIEGAEFSALESLDFDRYEFGIIFAEADASNQKKNMALRTLVESKGYTHIGFINRSDWFVNNNFHAIYKNLIY
eukprot:CAMPEP_0119545744 /NCGR_PEP_ID=MMETSP1352-20130426/413_1 /TAXON_ID=265584 /ORGANISM="Stauroneis constricta, Strain CCMP1120" /LENGTH=291 /DNA_ID=CAMNT_0007590339 /DNA_START=70 /DNA_END=945 /DNA_ORIENTATION=+